MSERGMFFRDVAPSVMAFALSGVYTIVDGFFVGNSLGDNGLAAINLGFPIAAFIQAAGTGAGLSGAIRFTILLGQKRENEARACFSSTVLLLALISILLTGGIFAALSPLLRLLGAEGELLRLTADYIWVIALGAVFQAFATGLVPFIRNLGGAGFAMWAMIAGFVTNIGLDYLFVWVYGLGMAGAAWATVIGQLVTLLWNLRYYLTGRRSLIALRLSRMPLRWVIDAEILGVGVSEFARQGALTVANTILMNQISRYGSALYIAAYAIMMKVSSIAVMPIFGIGQGMQPIVGYCYGAGLYGRARKAIEIALLSATVITVTGEIILLGFPHVFVRAFTDDAEVIRLTVWGVRILQSTFAIIGFQIVGTVTFQALGFAGPALFLSLSRQVIFFIPSLLVLPRFFGVAGVFLSYPVADVCACFVTLALLMALIFQPRAKE